MQYHHKQLCVLHRSHLGSSIGEWHEQVHSQYLWIFDIRWNGNIKFGIWGPYFFPSWRSIEDLMNTSGHCMLTIPETSVFLKCFLSPVFTALRLVQRAFCQANMSRLYGNTCQWRQPLALLGESYWHILDKNHLLENRPSHQRTRCHWDPCSWSACWHESYCLGCFASDSNAYNDNYQYVSNYHRDNLTVTWGVFISSLPPCWSSAEDTQGRRVLKFPLGHWGIYLSIPWAWPKCLVAVKMCQTHITIHNWGDGSCKRTNQLL